MFFSDPSGLSAEAEFTMLNPTTLEVRLRNTSTGVPFGFDEADQLLTGISWDFGAVGENIGDPEITGGAAVTGPSSASVNFDVTSVGANANVSGEYGYGNMDGTGAFENFVSGNTSQATPFGGPNLDGPVIQDGPQAGLLASPALITLVALGGIQDEIIATLTLSEAVDQADIFGDLGLARVEFGSDATFIENPEPNTLVLAVLALLSMTASFRRRKSDFMG